MSIKDSIMPHQVETVEFGMKNPYFIMGLPPGLGKTLCAQEIINRLKEKFKREELNVLYICPASVKLNIKDELLKWDTDLRISCFMEKKDIYPVWDTDYCIINYEMIKHCEFLFKWADILVVDEAHLAKNPEAQRSDLLHQFIFQYEIRRVMLLTGTPMANSVVDFYSLIAICYYNPRLPEDNEFLTKFPTFIDFAEHFSNRVEFHNDYGMKIKYEGVRNVKELKEYIKKVYITFDADKVLKIPAGATKHIQIGEIDDPNLLVDFRKFEVSDVGQTISSKSKMLSAVAMVKPTCNYVELLLKTGVDCVVVFTDHIDSANQIAAHFGVEAMTSHMKIDKRRELVAAFQRNDSDSPKVIVGTSVMGVSWTLTRSCNLVVSDFPWRPGDLDQLMRRIRRVCQKRTPIYHFMHGSFQSKYILKILERKMKDIKEVLDE